jgi:N-acetylglutamate synthase-like GNAT family acetyltransferase
MICQLTDADFQDILTVVNNAALAYKGKIPVDRWKVPYMSARELKEEIQSGVQFYGLKENNLLIAVMGIQLVNDVTLIRHAYVLTSNQRMRIGEKLLNHLLGLAKSSKIYVGTWEAADWAVKFYGKQGFELVSTDEKNKLLKKYWSIPEQQVETSVVLELKRQR